MVLLAEEDSTFSKPTGTGVPRGSEPDTIASPATSVPTTNGLDSPANVPVPKPKFRYLFAALLIFSNLVFGIY